MAFGVEAHQRRRDLVAFAADDELDVVEHGVEPVAEPLGVLIGNCVHAVPSGGGRWGGSEETVEGRTDHGGGGGSVFERWEPTVAQKFSA